MTRIPLPGNPGEAIQKGVESGTNLWQQLLGYGVNLGRMHQQGQQFNQQLGFNEKQLSQHHAHHLNQIGIEYQKLKHAEKILPYQIQHLEDMHIISGPQAEMMRAQAANYFAEAKKNTMFANLLDPYGGQSDQHTNIPEMTQNNMSLGGNQFQQPVSQTQNTQNVQPDTGSLNLGESTIVRPPEPGKERLDRIAGMMGIPAVQPFSENGVQYERWPSGKITAMRTGQTPEQKAELETRKKEEQKTNALHATEIQALEKEIPMAKEHYADIEELEKLYEKNKGHEKEWWGGLWPIIPEDIQIKGREKFINNEDYGRIRDIQAKLIGQQSQEYSTKGLAQGLILSQQNKPGFYEEYGNSLGKVKRIKEKAKKAIEREEKRYDELKGKAKMLKGIDAEGIKWDIRPEDKEAFIKSGGKI